MPPSKATHLVPEGLTLDEAESGDNTKNPRTVPTERPAPSIGQPVIAGVGMRHLGAPSKSSPRSIESIDATATISKALGPLDGSALLRSSLAWPGFGACVNRTRSTGPRTLIPPGFRTPEADPLGSPGRVRPLGDRPGATRPRTGPPIPAPGRGWRLAHHRAGRRDRGREGLQLRGESPRVERGRSRRWAGLNGVVIGRSGPGVCHSLGINRCSAYGWPRSTAPRSTVCR